MKIFTDEGGLEWNTVHASIDLSDAIKTQDVFVRIILPLIYTHTSAITCKGTNLAASEGKAPVSIEFKIVMTVHRYEDLGRTHKVSPQSNDTREVDQPMGSDGIIRVY